MFQADPTLLGLRERLRKHRLLATGTVVRRNSEVFFARKGEPVIPITGPEQLRVMHGDAVTAEIQMNSDPPSVHLIELTGSTPGPFLVRTFYRNRGWQASPLSSPWLVVSVEFSDGVPPPKGPGGPCNFLAEWVCHPFADSQKARLRLLQNLGRVQDAHYVHRLHLAKAGLPLENPFERAASLQEEARTRFKGMSAAIGQEFLDVPLVTIDGRDTKDMDDALGIVSLGEGRHALYVAIADPGALLPEDSPLLRFAKQLVESLYLPGYTLPMFPTWLSHDLASLRPMERRPALVCRWECLGEALVPDRNSLQIHWGWIEVKQQLDYERVSDWLDAGRYPKTLPSELRISIERLWRFAQHRAADRVRTAPPGKSGGEYEYSFDSQGRICSIEPKIFRSAHRLVEELMLFTNAALTEFANRSQAPGCLYSSQDGFQAASLPALSKQLGKLGLAMSADELATSEGYRLARTWVLGLPKGDVIWQQRFLMAAAGFSKLPSAHVALGAASYATWTSPIRKYGDLLNLRWLKSVTQGLGSAKEEFSEAFLTQLSQQRRTLRQARRVIHASLQRDYVQRLLRSGRVARLAKGTLFSARVIRCSEQGIWLSVDRLGLQGLLPLARLSRELRTGWRYDPLAGVLQSESQSRRVSSGDLLVVSLEPVGLQLGTTVTLGYIAGLEDLRPDLAPKNQRTPTSSPLKGKGSPASFQNDISNLETIPSEKHDVPVQGAEMDHEAQAEPPDPGIVSP